MYDNDFENIGRLVSQPPKRDFQENEKIYLNQNLYFTPRHYKKGANIYVIGQRGSGKTTAVKNIACQCPNAWFFDGQNNFYEEILDDVDKKSWKKYIIGGEGRKKLRMNACDMHHEVRRLFGIQRGSKDMLKLKLALERFINLKKPLKTYSNLQHMMESMKLELYFEQLKKILDKRDQAPPIESYFEGKIVFDIHNTNENEYTWPIFHLSVLGNRRDNVLKFKQDPKRRVLWQFIDECVQWGAKNTVTGNMVEILSLQGRKYGMELCLISQTFKGISNKTRRQMNYFLIHRLIDEDECKELQRFEIPITLTDFKTVPDYGCFFINKVDDWNKTPTRVDDYWRELKKQEEKNNSTDFVKPKNYGYEGNWYNSL